MDGGLRMASSLFDWAIAEIDMSARQRGHLAGANAMFMEVVNEQGDVHSGSFLFGSDLHSVFEQLNWRLVDFDFVSPPQVFFFLCFLFSEVMNFINFLPSGLTNPK